MCAVNVYMHWGVQDPKSINSNGTVPSHLLAPDWIGTLATLSLVFASDILNE